MPLLTPWSLSLYMRLRLPIIGPFWRIPGVRRSQTCWKTVDESVVGATTRRRGLELISAHAKLSKVLYILRVLFKHIEHKARYSYKGISPSEASWWPYLTIYDQNRFRMSIIPRIPDFTNVHFYSRATTVARQGGYCGRGIRGYHGRGSGESSLKTNRPKIKRLKQEESLSVRKS